LQQSNFRALEGGSFFANLINATHIEVTLLGTMTLCVSLDTLCLSRHYFVHTVTCNMQKNTSVAVDLLSSDTARW
jgi:hypothetical protein